MLDPIQKKSSIVVATGGTVTIQRGPAPKRDR